jgi:DNA-binding transcriptional LysR family regulator
LTRLEKNLDIQLMQRSSQGLVITDFGKDYLQSCIRALRTLREGRDAVADHRERPRGLIKVSCPITMSRSVLVPLLTEFLERYPDLRVEIESYVSPTDPEPREDVDISFKVRAPKDSNRRIRPFPSARRGLFASKHYLEKYNLPTSPDELVSHTCFGARAWKLKRAGTVVVPDVQFRVVSNDPSVHLEMVLKGLGIAILPLYMGQWPETRGQVVRILPRWNPEPITLCALFSGPSRLTPKVQAFLDFVGEYLGTERDPRLKGMSCKGMFALPG